MSKGKEATTKGSVINIAAGMLLAKALGRMGKWGRKRMFRWRRALTPLWFGFAVFLTAVIMRWQIPEWWSTALVLPVIGMLLAWFGPNLNERLGRVVMALVPQGLDAGKTGVLDRPVERIFFGSLMTYVGVYIAIRAGWGSSDFTGWMWKIGVAVWGGTWWYHRRVRVVGRAEKFARKWHIFTDKDTCPYRLGALAESRVIKAESKGRTSVLTIRLAPSQEAASVTHLTGPLASFFSLRMGSVFVSPDPEQARNCVITFLPKDPWRGKIPHPLPEPGTVSLAGMRKTFPMGLLAKGEQQLYKLAHTLVVGSSGSGKSAWLHALMGWLAAFTDAVVVGADMAAGATLNIWRKSLALPLATDVHTVIDYLERILGVIRLREIALGLAAEEDEDADDSFEPSVKYPWLIMVIDEFPDLLAEAKSTDDGKGGNLLGRVILLLSRIAKKARKCGVRIVLATQNGTKVDLGSKEMQAQLRAIVGLGLDSLQSKNLWGDLQKYGWRSTDLREGQFLLRDEEHTSPEIAKGYWVSPKERKAQAHASAELGRSLEPEAWRILMGLEQLDDEDLMAEQVADESDPVLEYLRNEGPAKAETISDRLTKSKPEGATYGTSRSTIYRHLVELRAQGLVVSLDDGLWDAVREPAEAPTPRKTESEPGTPISSIQGESVGA